MALEGIKGCARLTGVFHDIPAECRIPDFGAHGAMCVSIAGLNGTVKVLITHGGASNSTAARMVDGVVNCPWQMARTVRLGK